LENTAYGYKVFDVFVFVFLIGEYFRVNFYTQTIGFELVLPAYWIVERRCFKLNNMRDEASDRKSNKNTIVVKLAELKLKYTITFLL
jgi:1,4-dihydroxy-2-naphthoate octaprenyltransferase